MSNNNATTHELLRHLGINPPPSFELRETLGFKGVKFSLKGKSTPFSIMTQNMALKPDAFIFASYDGTNREGAVTKIIERIKELSPDVVGLCEVFVDDERKRIWNSVKHMYRFWMEGPDSNVVFDLQDGGCMLLSKHNVLASKHIVYKTAGGEDTWSSKGVLHMRIKTPTAPRPFEIFYTHAQDIGATNGVTALHAQLDQLNAFINNVEDPDNPVFIFGDLNAPGEVPGHHRQLITRLGNPVDLWLVSGGSPGGGFTFVSDNNFYEDPDDNPHLNQRLDYILMRAGKRLVPILDDIQILKFKLNGRDLSDHFGLRATFEQSILIDF